MHRRIITAIATMWLVAACAPANNAEYDPLEPMNRQIFAFNEVVDDFVIAPVARGYRAITPQYARDGVNNFLNNLGEPVNMLNGLLQLDPEQTFTSFWRFVLNTTFGFGGFVDFAGENTELAHRKEGFGDTLGVWGVDAGPYIVLPIMGPSNGRDLVGRVVDGFTDPFNYLLADPDVSDGNDGLLARGVVTGLAQREQLLETLDAVYEDSFDPYATIRSAYTQQRESAIANEGAE